VIGMMIREVLADMENVLGWGGGPFTVGQATSMGSIINLAFVNGTPSQFAQDKLVNGPCP
jgi:hypothetical protein